MIAISIMSLQPIGKWSFSNPQGGFARSWTFENALRPDICNHCFRTGWLAVWLDKGLSFGETKHHPEQDNLIFTFKTTYVSGHSSSLEPFSISLSFRWHGSNRNQAPIFLYFIYQKWNKGRVDQSFMSWANTCLFTTSLLVALDHASSEIFTCFTWYILAIRNEANS